MGFQMPEEFLEDTLESTKQPNAPFAVKNNFNLHCGSFRQKVGQKLAPGELLQVNRWLLAWILPTLGNNGMPLISTRGSPHYRWIGLMFLGGREKPPPAVTDPQGMVPKPGLVFARWEWGPGVAQGCGSSYTTCNAYRATPTKRWPAHLVYHHGTVQQTHGFGPKISGDTLTQTRGNGVIFLSAPELAFSLLVQAPRHSAPQDHTKKY